MTERKRRRHSPQQIVEKLQEADCPLNAGQTLGQVLQVLEVSKATYHRWRGHHEPAVERSLLSPSEAMLINALYASQCVLTDPASALPVHPSLSTVLARRNDVSMVLVRPRGGDLVDFKILECQERIEHQGRSVSEMLPAAETDENLSPLDEALCRFDDHYLDYLADRASSLTVEDYTVAASQGLSFLLQQVRGPVLERLRLSFSEVDVLWHGSKSRCSGSTWRQSVTDIERIVDEYSRWMGDKVAYIRRDHFST
jgi:hypothetical protein